MDILDHVLAGERVVRFGKKSDAEMKGDRIITTLPFFAYLKIAEGCSNNCTYCAIPAIRGPYRSVPMEDVLEEAHWLAEHHVTELVVIAQDTTRYGCDLYGKSRLPELLRELCHIDGIRWVRVLYCYPERITDELLDVLAEEPHMVPYLDLPIQHCDGEILRRMHRPGNEETLRKTIAHIRERVPDITLRTTLITGFPARPRNSSTGWAISFRICSSITWAVSPIPKRKAQRLPSLKIRSTRMSGRTVRISSWNSRQKSAPPRMRQSWASA